MGLGKQSKVLTNPQIDMVSKYLRSGRNGLRNQTIFLLSVKGGFRSKEISELRWEEILNSNSEIDDCISLTNRSAKGKSGGRKIPIHKDLRTNLVEMLNEVKIRPDFSPKGHVIQSERSKRTSSQAIINMFYHWYLKLGLIGCSSHSGRRTFITNTSKKISLVGGSLRDIQLMVGHSSLQTTQRYIEGDSESQRKVVSLI